MSATPEGVDSRTTALDETFVRAQFPAFAEPSLQGFAHLENAGGSFACAPVVERLDRFYRATKLQPYYPAAPSTTGGEAMDEARSRWAGWLGVGEDELHFGPSTSQNTWVLANALRTWLEPGDEVVVTQQDHEANIGAFARLADEGFTVRTWKVDPHSGELDGAGLDAVLSNRTRAVAFTHCSNVVGSINPVRDWCERIRAAGALSIVDGVSAAPHGTPQVPDLGCDVYLFSLYKVYGPHLGLMTLSREWNERLPSQGHYFNAGKATARFTPAGPDHAQIAAAAGVIDYFESLDARHVPGADPAGAPGRVYQLLRATEQALVAPLLAFLDDHPAVRLVGRADTTNRAPTVSFTVEQRSPRALAEALADEQIGTGYGDFYARRLVEALGIDPVRGVLRCSLVHYNTAEEVGRLVEALDRLLVE